MCIAGMPRPQQGCQGDQAGSNGYTEAQLEEHQQYAELAQQLVDDTAAVGGSFELLLLPEQEPQCSQRVPWVSSFWLLLQRQAHGSCVAILPLLPNCCHAVQCLDSAILPLGLLHPLSTESECHMSGFCEQGEACLCAD